MKKILMIIGLLLVLVGSNFITYKVTQKQNQKELDTIRLEIQSIQNDYVNSNELNDSLKNRLENLQETVDNQIMEQEKENTKQSNCIKMNELKQLSPSIVLRTSGESGGNGCSTVEATKMITREIEQTYEYVKGYKENYDKTGMQVWKHSPDLCIYDVNKYWDDIESQYNEYLKYKNLCNQ